MQTQSIEDVLNLLAKDKDLPEFGKYTKDSLVQHFLNNYISKPDFLVQYGLVLVEYQNIENNPSAFRTFYTFTDKWRLLRKLGSYDALVLHEKANEDRENEKKELEYEFIKSQNDFVTKQTGLVNSQIETNENVKTTNSHIVTNNKTTRIILWVTVGVAATNLIPASISVIHDYKKDYSGDTIKRKQERIELLETKIIRDNWEKDSLRKVIILKSKS